MKPSIVGNGNGAQIGTLGGSLFGAAAEDQNRLLKGSLLCPTRYFSRQRPRAWHPRYLFACGFEALIYGLAFLWSNRDLLVLLAQFLVDKRQRVVARG